MGNKALIIIGIIILVGGVLYFNSTKRNTSNGVSNTNSSLVISGGVAKLENANPHNGVVGEQLAQDFSFEKDGKTVKLSDYRGVKPVVLDFWASWCPNCQRSMPVLNRIYLKNKDKFEVIGVNMQEPVSTANSFLKSRNIVFPSVMDPSGSLRQAYDINYTNVHVLIGRNGGVLRTILGDISEADVLSLIAPS